MGKRQRRRSREALAGPEGSGSIRLFAQLGLRVPADLALRLKRHCQETGRSLNEVAKEALTRYLDRESVRR